MVTSKAVSNDVSHEEQGHGGTFYIEQDGKRVAVMTYARNDPSLVTIEHTKVDPSLEGQGVARRLFDAAVSWARATQTKMIPVCSYAAAQFQNDPSTRDVLK